MHASHLRHQAYEYIQQQILAGTLTGGSQVSELSLAKAIGISRTPVREAVRQLVHEGVLEQVPRFGTIVRSPERQDIVDLYELREALESYAASQAADRIDRDDLALLGRLCDEIAGVAAAARKKGAASLDAAGLKRFVAADLAFHMVMIRAAGNRRILKTVADSRVLTRLFSTPRQRHELAIVDKTYRYHSKILRALRRGDAPAARDLLAEHIRASRDEALEYHDRHCVAKASPFPLGLPGDLLAELAALEQGFDNPAPGKRKKPRVRA
ncbi:GntR family transcriptional regulator [Planctomycetaceae bacterium SCGC AG-212-F19]|nr:GntR family transcriptional regulator [Planctomycetaceae bacterium SCGC AG-212-F19]